MKRIILFSLTLFCFGFSKPKQELITKEGEVTFFSYASAENIKASNNQVLSILDVNSNKIAVSMLMRGFVFEKALMQEHFNESYIESDLFPRATFEGTILNFDTEKKGTQTKIIEGNFILRGITMPIKIKATITKNNKFYLIKGDTQLKVKDFKIKIPRILSSKIAETVKVSFNLKYETHEK